MKILFLKPLNQSYYVIQPPLGQGYLASIAIQKNHECKILDSGKENLTWQAFKNHIKNNFYDLICIQMFAQEFLSVKKHSEIINKLSLKTMIIFGGAHVSCDPENSLKSMPFINFGFVGESELSFEKFLGLEDKNFFEVFKKQGAIKLFEYFESDLEKVPGLVWRKNQDIVVNSRKTIENLDDIPYPLGN